VAALINHQYESGLPVTSRSGAVLRHPIPRERWELNNDDIILGDKIGRVSCDNVAGRQFKSGEREHFEVLAKWSFIIKILSSLQTTNLEYVIIFSFSGSGDFP